MADIEQSTGHLTTSEIEDYRRLSLPSDEWLRLDAHLSGCSDCRLSVARSASLSSTKHTAALLGYVSQPQPFLSYEEMVAYVDDRLSPEQRNHVQHIVATNVQYQREVEDLRKVKAELAVPPVKEPTLDLDSGETNATLISSPPRTPVSWSAFLQRSLEALWTSMAPLSRPQGAYAASAEPIESVVPLPFPILDTEQCKLCSTLQGQLIPYGDRLYVHIETVSDTQVEMGAERDVQVIILHETEKEEFMLMLTQLSTYQDFEEWFENWIKNRDILVLSMPVPSTQLLGIRMDYLENAFPLGRLLPENAPNSR